MDIVKAIYKPKDEDLTIDHFIIKWDKYYCQYVGHYARKENVYNPLLFGSQTSFEVIGNIFDNPELINDGELLNSCSQVEVLKWFAEKWKEVRENENK